MIAKIHDEVVEALGRRRSASKLALQLMEPIGNSPAQFRAKIDADLARWSPVIKALDIKINCPPSVMEPGLPGCRAGPGPTADFEVGGRRGRRGQPPHPSLPIAC